MRFVPVKTMEQPGYRPRCTARAICLIKNRTMLVNALRAPSGGSPGQARGHGSVSWPPKGIGKLPDLIKIVSEAPAEALPEGGARRRFRASSTRSRSINVQLDGHREAASGLAQRQ